MQKQKIILTNEIHLDNPVVSLVFEKDASLIDRIKYRNFWGTRVAKPMKPACRRQVYTHVTDKSLQQIKSPANSFFGVLNY